MARGRKTPQAKIEQAVAVLQSDPDATITDAARAAGLPRQTVSTLLPSVMDDEAFGELRQRQKRELVAAAWEPIKDSVELMRREIRRMIDSGVVLTPHQLQAIATTFGIAYDKAALAAGESATGAASVGDVMGAAISAWEAGREAGRRDAEPRNVTPASE